MDIQPPPKNNHPQKTSKTLRIFIQLLFCAIILGCGVALAKYYLDSAPKAKPKKRQPSPPIVQVLPLSYQPHTLEIESLGTVVGAREINLAPKVSGEIIELSDNMIPGGILKKNEPLVTVDPADYKLALLQLKSEVAKTKSDLDLEMGNQRIAQKEYELLGQNVSEAEKKLMLRQPQLEIAKANLNAITAQLEQAELELARTKVTAPFNSVVITRSVNLGTYVSQSTPLAKLVGTDQFWVQLTVPVEQLKWISIPSQTSKAGAPVRIYLVDQFGGKGYRTAHLFKLAANLEEQGRMAVVYAAIEDPLCLLPENRDKPKILLGSFVRAIIKGKELDSVVALDRKYLQDNNKLYLVDDDHRLHIRKVSILTRSKERIIIDSGVMEGEQLIITGLKNPVEGSQLRLLKQTKEAASNADHTNKNVRPASTKEEAKR